MKARTLGLVAAVALLVASHSVHAQDVIEEDLKQTVSDTAKPAEPDGWKLGLSLGSTISFNHNSRVVGVPDGINFQIGVLLDTYANLRKGDHEWLNSLKIQETFSKTPTIDLFLKSNDLLEVKTTYLYHIPGADWLGPFARISLNTAIFPGFDARAEDVGLDKTGDSVADETAPAQSTITLTKAFEPVTLKEAVGMYANAIDEEAAKVSFQLGIGGHETFTQEGFVINDDPDTPVLELQQLEDYYQVGGELQVEAKGLLNELVSWGAGASFFQPFYSSIDRDLSGIDLMSIETQATLSVKLMEWASLDYVLSAKREPLIIDEWQVSNGLLFTAGFNVFSPPPEGK